MTATTTRPSQPASTGLEFKVAHQNDAAKFAELAAWGRKEIELAEKEMPGLMATRAEFGPKQPLKGQRIMVAPGPGNIFVAKGVPAQEHWRTTSTAPPKGC